MSKESEKRRHPRVALKGSVRFRVPDQMDISMASIKNISDGGLCLLTEDKIAAGEILSLEFAVPGEPGATLCVGEVRWVEDMEEPQGRFKHRIGIEFLEIGHEKRKRIKGLVVGHLKSQVHDEVTKGKNESDKRPSILIIDDDRVTLNLINDVFKDEFDVMTADGGRKGIELAREWKPSIILLDIIMPDMDGFSTLMNLKEFPETADIPVVMLSVVRDKQKVFQAIQYGAKDFMIKPFTSETLIQKIRKFSKEQEEKG